MEIDLSKYSLNEEQREILSILQVPIYHNPHIDKYFIAKNYWRSIKPELQKALLRVVCSNE